MKTMNFNTLLKLAAALGFLGLPVGAAAYSVPSPRPAMALNAAVSSTLATGTFGSLLLSSRVFEGADCAGENWFSASLKTCLPAVIGRAELKAQRGPALADADLKVKSDEPAPRVKRVSRLQEPGEAMGGGKERKEAAAKKAAASDDRE